MSEYRCESCEATYAHPDVEECETVDGRCAHLMTAGWRPVWVRVTVERPPPAAPRRRRVGARRAPTDRHIFSRGGWICPECAANFLDPRRRNPPKERRLARGTHQEGRTR